MKAYKFTVASHEDYGSIGFRPAWYPAGDPLGGMAVAHDILEHFPKDDGSPEGEYQALGASLYIRGNGDDPRNLSPEESIAADLSTVWDVLVNRERRSFVEPCASSKDADLMKRARLAVSYWVSEAKAEYSQDEKSQPDFISQERVACWIAKGYRRAAARYRGISRDMLLWDLFKPIEEQADKALKRAEEGMILTVLVDISNRGVRVFLNDSEGGDYD